MEHTYLRYECADSFGLTLSSASSKAPPSNRSIKCVGNNSNNNSNNIVLTTTASYVTGISIKSSQIVLKLGHRETSNIGTGRALNSDEVVCLDVCQNKVATGWIDGTVRVFDDVTFSSSVSSNNKAIVNSLIDDDRGSDSDNNNEPPLVLNGHAGSPVRTVVFDDDKRLASGGSDGKVVLWDLVSETGLFRLIGHRGGITDIAFFRSVQNNFDGLASSSLDGLVKIWDLEGQCCTQTIASHRGEIWAGTCMQLNDEKNRCRLFVGSSDGQVSVWSIASTKVSADTTKQNESTNNMMDVDQIDNKEIKDQDDICHFMGRLIPPPNVATSSDKISCIHCHGRYVGVLHANSKTVDMYMIRSTQETLKKKQRRLKRRQEKQKKKQDEGRDGTKKSGQKRGILDDPESSDDDDDDVNNDGGNKEQVLDPELIKASDEFEYLTTVRASHKIKGFAFIPQKLKKELLSIVCGLSTNALETYSIIREVQSDKSQTPVITTERVNTMDFYGHPTGIRSIAISSDDRLSCTVSKSVVKIWNVASRTCIQSISPVVKSGKKSSCYGLCTAFLPGNTHVAVGTREGHLLLIDLSSGDVVYSEEKAHEGAVWSVDVRRPNAEETTINVITGSADKTVKFWVIESQEEDEDHPGQPMFVHTRTLQMTDDVIAARYSKTLDSTKRMVFVSTLDCTIKVFFEDSLKMFLSLYGHKLPALAVDCSDDDTILASSGADKTVKIWGLDFGDTHKTLHGHEDSITDLRFVRRTHNFFTASKDGSVRYWDGDRFEQILLLNGHCAEVNCLAISRTGAFVLSGGMDRQVRVWERTKDIVFLEEERERELEKIFDRVSNREEDGTGRILDRKRNEGDDSDDDEDIVRDDEPQSEAAVKRSVLSVAAGDRIMEAVERADQELKDIALFKKANGSEKKRAPNMLMLGLEPAHYILWVLRTIKSAELEQSLLILPLRHIERLMYYLILLLRVGRGVELCSRVAIFLVKTHQSQIISTRTMAPLLKELKRLIRLRVAEARDVVGYDLAALKLIAKAANERRQSFNIGDDMQKKDVWAGMGLGSDVAAALEGRSKKRK